MSGCVAKGEPAEGAASAPETAGPASCLCLLRTRLQTEAELHSGQGCPRQFLGDDGDKALQAWTPDDRIIDAKGQEYRFVHNTDKTRYSLEPTSQTWTAEKLLEVAVADARLLKKDDDALRRRVTAVPEEKRMPVLMKCIDDLPPGPAWTIVALILFLVRFFFAVVFAVWAVFALIGYWIAHHRH
jgi:hypothetical protein